jgi:phage terminase large subunit GpA-like protein
VFLTAGVDVQKDRIELEVVGWGRNLESWSIDYAVLHGDTASDEVGEQLSAVVRQDYGRMDGMRLPIRMAAVDTGFRTQEVYRWVKSQSALRVMAVKGREQQATIISQPSTVEVTIRGKRIRGGIKVWPVGVSVAKSELYGWLRRRLPSNLEEGLPYGWCHFPQHTEEYFKQLTAESLVSRIVRGYQKYQWEKTRDRNEALDCRVYNRAAAMAIGADRWDDKRWEYEAGQSFNGMATVSAQTAQVSQQSPIKRRKSTFL